MHSSFSERSWICSFLLFFAWLPATIFSFHFEIFKKRGGKNQSKEGKEEKRMKASEEGLFNL